MRKYLNAECLYKRTMCQWVEKKRPVKVAYYLCVLINTHPLFVSLPKMILRSKIQKFIHHNLKYKMRPCMFALIVS